MGFKAGAITGTIGLDNKPAVKAVREVAAEAKGMKAGVEEATKGADAGMRKMAGSAAQARAAVESVAKAASGIKLAVDSKLSAAAMNGKMIEGISQLSKGTVQLGGGMKFDMPVRPNITMDKSYSAAAMNGNIIAAIQRVRGGTVQLGKGLNIDTPLSMRAKVTPDVAEMRAAAPAMAAVAMEYRNIGQGVDKADQSFKGFLKGIGSQAGKGSALGMTMKTLAGGGVLMGLSMGGHLLEEFSQTLVDIKKEVGETGDDWEKMTEKVAGSIPIFGSFFKTGLNIRELFSGERADIERLTEQFKEHDAAILTHKIWKTVSAEKGVTYADAIRQARAEVGIAGATGLDADLKRIAQQRDNAITRNAAMKGDKALTPEERMEYDAKKREVQQMHEPKRPSQENLAWAGRALDWQGNADHSPESRKLAKEFKAQEQAWIEWSGKKAVLVQRLHDLDETKTKGTAAGNALDELARQKAGLDELNARLAVAGQKVSTWWEGVNKQWDEGRATLKNINVELREAKRALGDFSLSETEKEISSFIRNNPKATPQETTLYSDLKRMRESMGNKKLAMTPAEKFADELNRMGETAKAGGMDKQTYARLSGKAELAYMGDLNGQFAGYRAPSGPVLAGDLHGMEGVVSNNNGPNSAQQAALQAAQDTVARLDVIIGLTPKDRAQALQEVAIGN